MSLINQMLQDLDARRAAHGVGSALPNDVRPLPVVQNSRLPLILGIVVLLVAAAGLAYYQWGMRPELAPPAAPAVITPVVVVPVVPPLAQPVPEPEVIVQPEPPIAEPAPPDIQALNNLGGSLRMAESISPPAEKKVVTKPVATPTAPEKSSPAEKKPADNRGKAIALDAPAPASPVVSPSASNPSAKPPMIEKTVSVGSPRERAEVEYRKAIVAVNQGRVVEALDGLRIVLKLDGFHVASRQLLVKLLLEANQPEDAIQVLQDGLKGQPAHLGWAMSLARLQVDRGDLAGAWQTLNYSLPAAGSNPDYQGFAAHLLQRLGRNKEAAERYQAAARLSPGDGRWWLGLGLAWEAEERSAEAREAFLRARQSGNLSAELLAMIEQKLR